MTTTQAPANKTEHKSAKKRQQSFPHTDIGTPRVPIRQRKTKQQQELLSDWNHAS
jgi:hypothetical protein